ncbi:hypothetical protein C8Q74DRAFT_1205533 [Fomes fomentarius]|nr:hypothetical protein C8Q74DRAFT_1205533 [Fomes fomentarius]
MLAHSSNSVSAAGKVDTKDSEGALHRPHTITRPIPLFHSTRAIFVQHNSSEKEIVGGRPHTRWSSRASRKNRYSQRSVRIAHAQHAPAKGEEPPLHELSSHLRPSFTIVKQRIHHSEGRLKVHLAWDISFWVAVVFVLGSTIWVVNGFILFLPLENVGSDEPSAAAWSAFVGGTLFEVGSYLMYVEALNTGHEELFGLALWNVVGEAASEDPLIDPRKDDSEGEKRPHRFRWIGFGPWRELGFLACFIQIWAATIFWVSTITGLPNVIQGLPQDPPTAITDVFYWSPQVIGGTGFVISSLLLMVEVQKRWWLPNLRSMGWHVALWNLFGAVGFTLCGALGYASLSSSGVNYQSVLSTFWGSWAFLIGSIVQLWETLWREDPE